MKKLCKITFVVVFIILIMLKRSNAEPVEGYVINMQGDTIKCTFDKAFFGSAKYTPLNDKHAVKIDADKIKEFCYADKLPFVSINLLEHKKRIFATRLEKGSICLFEMIEARTSGAIGSPGSTSSTITYWFVSKTGGNDVIPVYVGGKYLVTLAGGDKVKKRFDDLLSDNAALVEKFKSKDDYSQEAIQAVIQEYNRAAPKVK